MDSSDEGKLKAFILGASGEVGKAVVKEAVKNENFGQIVLIGRRALTFDDSDPAKKCEQRIIDFDKIEEHKAAFSGFDVGFCCLGTTRGKAGAQGFVKVDHDYVVESAKLAKEGGCRHFLLVTSQGASKNSLFLYPRTKGLAEEHTKEVGFERISIFRPALLLCERSESRPFETFAQRFSKAVDVGNWFSIPTETVAKAMVVSALKPETKPVEIFCNADIFKLASP